jgi:cob(I)alamin adenosyltransferase
MAKIYTKTGDAGSTGLIGGTRVPKNDIRLDAYGTLDELNAQLGMLICELSEEHDVEFVQTIQHQLFRLGSSLATDASVTEPHFKHPVSDEMVLRLEQEIDHIELTLPKHNHFVLPGGNKAAACCHVARTVCRRAERLIIQVMNIHETDPAIATYVNRLSDYLFVLSRKACIHDSPEFFWDPSK